LFSDGCTKRIEFGGCVLSCLGLVDAYRPFTRTLRVAALVKRDVVFDDNIFEAKAKGWRRGVVVSGVRRMN